MYGDRRRTRPFRAPTDMAIEFFRSSQITTDCDRCGGRVDLLKGGVCTRCLRILCYAHLHGSWLRRVAADLGAGTVCTDCRAGRRTAAASTGS